MVKRSIFSTITHLYIPIRSLSVETPFQTEYSFTKKKRKEEEAVFITTIATLSWSGKCDWGI